MDSLVCVALNVLNGVVPDFVEMEVEASHLQRKRLHVIDEETKRTRVSKTKKFEKIYIAGNRLEASMTLAPSP